MKIPKRLTDQLERLGAILDPVRRRLFLYVSRHRGEVSRDDAARAAGVSRALAAFHLDKLVDSGLLAASFRRLSGRTGPGAGRPSKLYRPAGEQLDVSLPERRYEWAAHVLARAVSATASPATQASLREVAREQGEHLGRQLAGGSRSSDALRRAGQALEACGYQPERLRDGTVVLGNCPFDSLRDDCREVTCDMNLSLIEGVLAGLEAPSVRATLEPRPGYCCVVLRKDSA